MKVAVSIPDKVFEETESLAKKLKASRSEIYSRALAEFLGRHVPERLTELMDRVVEDLGVEEPDAFRTRAARQALKRTEW
jgi:metal-responsive CopG/Arc/MetJ family transcriptional regulator